MALFNEIKNRLSNSGSITFCYNYINYGGKAIYVEGIKKVVSVAQEEILVLVEGKKGIRIFGDSLSIMELETSSMIVSGKIKSITEEVI